MGRLQAAIEGAWERGGWLSVVLAPLGWLYAAVMAARNTAYDLGLLRVHDLGLPAVSVGNLTVGGSGKTPVSAWLAQRLLARGERPAILLRGYGADEPLVHAHLTPDAIVVADPDRVAGAARARALGATVLVLDDAFQHRRVRRAVDLVLVAAEQGMPRRVLPAGPLRERRAGLRRATLAVVTRKAASPEAAAGVASSCERLAPGVPILQLHLRPEGLVCVGPAGATTGATAATAAGTLRTESLGSLQGDRVLAVSAIGAPESFERQLRGAGAHVTAAAYPDHHAFTPEDVLAITARASGAARVVCTLKDAVKLGPLWSPQAPPLWYLSQTVVIERGGEAVEALLDRLGDGRRS